MMKRRQFLHSLIAASGLATLPLASRPVFAQSTFEGKFLMALQLDGGIDVTAFCDPKMNVPGELEINQWAQDGETQTIGNISYAPFAQNQSFFEKYYRDMLVINGVDSQTNSHTVGIVHNWSGRNSTGYPTITSIYAAANASEQPMAYLNFGGFGNTEGLIRSTRVDDVSVLRNIIFPNENPVDQGTTFRRSSDWQRILELQQANMSTLADTANLPAGNANNRAYYRDALLGAEGLQVFGNIIPAEDSIQPRRGVLESWTSSLHQQIQVSLLAFSSGVSVAADLFEGGFDTHANNDSQQSALMSNVTDAIDYLWTTAEELGIADRLVLLIGSDFGRTPHYNSGNGKDHWPIGSNIVMEKNVSFTNRVFGVTDGGHNAQTINTSTGAADANGILITPAHVHLALRDYMGIGNHALSSQFPFNNTEQLDLFS